MTASTLPARRLPGAAALAATVWLILAIAAGATGFFLRLPFPGPQLIILGLVVVTLVAGLVPSRLSAWIDAVPAARARGRERDALHRHRVSGARRAGPDEPGVRGPRGLGRH